MGGERPYGVFLLMNAMAPEYVCFQCRAFEKAFRRAAALFPAEERLERGVHFATLDLKDNRSLFVEVCGGAPHLGGGRVCADAG